MKKPDPTEQTLDRLTQLRAEPNSANVTTELRKALKDRSDLVIARAATIAGELLIAGVIPTCSPPSTD